MEYLLHRVSNILHTLSNLLLRFLGLVVVSIASLLMQQTAIAQPALTGASDIATGAVVNRIDVINSNTTGRVQFTQSSQSVSETDGSVELKIERVGGIGGSISITVDITDGTAINGEDFKVSSSHSLTWFSGESKPKTIEVAIIKDRLSEKTEQFTARIRPVDAIPGPRSTRPMERMQQSIIGEPSSQVVSITDAPVKVDEPPKSAGKISFKSATESVNEDAGTITLFAERTGGTAGPLEVSIAAKNGSATAGSDFTPPAPKVLKWDSGDAKSKKFVVKIINDGKKEPNENFTVQLSSTNNPTNTLVASAAVPTGPIGSPSKVTVTINDVTKAPPGSIHFSKATASVKEDAGKITVTVERTGGTAGPLQANIAVKSGIAIAGSDFSAPAPQVLKWAAGESKSKPFDIKIINDGKQERDEDFTIELTEVTNPNTLAIAGTVGAVGKPNKMTITIINVQPKLAGKVQFTKSADSIPENAGRITVEVERTGGTDGELKVDVAVKNGSATAGSDFAVIKPKTLTWVAGVGGSKPLNIDIFKDDLPESDETFTVELSNVGKGDVLGTPNKITVTIKNVTPRPTGQIQLAKATEVVDEDAGTVTVIAQRVGGTAGRLEANISAQPGTAKAGSDFKTPEPKTFTWESGKADSKPYVIELVDDDVVELKEQFSVSLSEVAEGNAVGSPSKTTITINDDDEELELRGSIRLSKISETVSEDAGIVTVFAERVDGTDGILRAQVSTENGTALAGQDYTALAPKTLTWAANNKDPIKIEIAIQTDELTEQTEKFNVKLAPVGEPSETAVSAPSTFTVSIRDVPPESRGKLQFTLASASVKEDAGSIAVGVRRVGGPRGAISAGVATRNGTAIAGQDYTALAPSKILNWAAGESDTRTVNIPISNDGVQESAENFFIDLVANEETPADSIGTPDSVTVSIVNVQPPDSGTIRFSRPATTVTEGTAEADVFVERTGGSDGVLSVSVSSADGTAEDGADYIGLGAPKTLTWADGETKAIRIPVRILDDAEVEQNETFTLSLSATNDAILSGTKSHTVTIADRSNPGQLSFSTASLQVTEQAGRVVASVVRRNGKDGAVSVRYRTQSGVATEAQDFVAKTGVLNWANGDTKPKTIDVEIRADNINEADEQFFIELDQATPLGDDLQLGQPARVSVTIQANEIASAGTVAFTQSTFIAQENEGSARVGVRRQGGDNGAISVSVSTLDGSALAAEDYTAVFSVVLASSDAGLIQGDGTAAVLIKDDDSTEIENLDAGVIVVEPNAMNVSEAAGTIEFEVQRTLASAGAISVGYAFVNGSAIAGEDFNGTNGVLTWADGDFSPQTISVNILRDALVEVPETFSIQLANEVAPENHSLVVATRTISINITDATDRGTVRLLSDQLTVDENDGTVTVTAERSGGSDGVIEVSVRVNGLSAELGSDFSSPASTLRWEDGEDGVKSIDIPILRDESIEQDESFTVSLLSDDATAVVDSTSETTVTIQDATAPQDSPYELTILSGDNQQATFTSVLEPLLISVTSRGDPSQVENAVSVRWRVEPAGAVRFINGDVTTTDQTGQTSNQIEVLATGFIRVIATALLPTATRGGNLQARIDPPPIELAPGQVAFLIRAGLEATPGLTLAQSRTASALDSACQSLNLVQQGNATLTAEQADLLQTCQALEQSTTLANDLDVLAPEEAFAIADSMVDTTDLQVTNIYSRINALRAGNTDRFDLSDMQLNIYDQLIPGAVLEAAQNAVTQSDAEALPSAGGLFSRLGFFVNGALSSGELDGDGRQQNADVSTSGLTFGADYRLSDSLVFGAGLGVVNNDTDFTTSAGGASIAGVNLSLFGTWYEGDKGYLDVVLDVGQNSYDIKRQLSLSSAPELVIASGETDASVVSFNVGAGRNFLFGSGIEFGPYMRLAILSATVDAYSEKASAGTAGFGSTLNVRSHSVRSTVLSVGGQISKSFSTGFGVLLPQLRIEYENENETRKKGLTASFQADPNDTAFTIQGNERDDSYLNIGIGSSVLLKNGKSGYAFYETRAQHDFVTQHWFKLGLRMEF